MSAAAPWRVVRLAGHPPDQESSHVTGGSGGELGEPTAAPGGPVAEALAQAGLQFGAEPLHQLVTARGERDADDAPVALVGAPDSGLAPEPRWVPGSGVIRGAGPRTASFPIGQITCPVLVTDPDHEQFWPGQSRQLYDKLPAGRRGPLHRGRGRGLPLRARRQRRPRRAHLRLARPAHPGLTSPHSKSAPHRLRSRSANYPSLTRTTIRSGM